MRRWLRAWRLRATRRRLRAAGAPHSVLFICHGNLCRSPYAAGAFSRFAGRSAIVVRVASAGFVTPGMPAPTNAVAAAAARGVDLSTHRSRQISVPAVAAAEVLVVMEPGQARAVRSSFGRDPAGVLVLGDLDPDLSAARTILDPVDQSREIFDAVYARIDRCLAQWIGLMLGHDP